MAKLKRQALLHYIDSSFGGTTPVWFLVGTDMEELAVEMNPDVSTLKNILGETKATDNGYDPQISADPYYANPDDAIYEKIKDIALKRLTGDDCKTKVLEVIIDDDAATTFEAYQEDVIIKPTSYGGGSAGVNIPFDVYFDGNRQTGTVTAVSVKAKAPVFTAAT